MASGWSPIRRARARWLANQDRPTLPLPTARDVQEQPRDTARNWMQQTVQSAASRVSQVQQQRNDISQFQNALAQQQEAENTARMERVRALLTMRRMEENRQQAEELDRESLLRAFMPRRPSRLYLDKVAFDTSVPGDQAVETARRWEGMENARRFGETVQGMSAYERATLAPLAQSMSKEGIEPETLAEIVNVAQGRDPWRA